MSRCQECGFKFKNIEDIYLVIAHGGKIGHPVCVNCLKQNYPEQYKKEVG